MSRFINIQSNPKVISSTSSKNNLPNDVDEFWKDCLTYDFSNQDSKTAYNHNAEEYITFSNNINNISQKPSCSANNLVENQSHNKESANNSHDANKEDYLSKKYSDLLQKYSSENLVTPEEIQRREREEAKKKNSMERSFILYQKGKFKNEVNKIMFHKNEELKIEKEMRDCTWKPKISKINKKLEENMKIVTKDIQFYNRALHWKNKNDRKINRSKSELHKENLDYTYRPVINENPNLNEVFNEDRTVYRDINTRSFVFRYEKAREEQEDKKKRVIRDLGDKLKDKWSRTNLIKSSSMKEISKNGEYKQTLRDELHSIKYEDTE